MNELKGTGGNLYSHMTSHQRKLFLSGKETKTEKKERRRTYLSYLMNSKNEQIKRKLADLIEELHQED